MSMNIRYFNYLKEEPDKVPSIEKILLPVFSKHQVGNKTKSKSATFGGDLREAFNKIDAILNGRTKPLKEQGYIVHKRVTNEQVLIAEVNQQNAPSLLQIKGFTIDSMIIYAQDSEIDTFERLIDYLNKTQPKLSTDGNLYYVIEVEGTLRVTKTPFSTVTAQYHQALTALNSLGD